jgi:heat shock protein HslJ
MLSSVAKLALTVAVLATVSCTPLPAANVSPSASVPAPVAGQQVSAPVTTGALAEGSWEVTELRIGEAVRVLEIGERIALDVHPGNLVTAQTTCSAFAGSFATDGQTITFADVTSAGACSDPAVAAIGSAFAAALEAARTVVRTEKGVSLTDGSGETVATLESGAEAAASGVNALLTEVTSLLSETESVLDETKSVLAATEATLADVDAAVAETNELLAGIQDAVASIEARMLARIDQSEGRITSRLQDRFKNLTSAIAEVRAELDARLQDMRQELAGVRDSIDARLQDLADKLQAQVADVHDALEARLDTIEGRLEAIDDGLRTRLAEVEDALDARLQAIESRLDAIEERLPGTPSGIAPGS